MSDIKLGLDDSFMCSWEDSNILIHQDVRLPLTQLKDQAREVGINLKLVSGYRSFENQLRIWNEKSLGKRKILDDQNSVVKVDHLSDWELIQRILRFSALPGTSRHHWGTDLDIVDCNSFPAADYKVQLIPDEFREHGPFYKLNNWMKENLAQYNFVHPYDKDTDGVSPEAWHISYAPLSKRFSELYDFGFFKNFLLSDQAKQIQNIRCIQEHAQEIYQRFILVK